MRYGSVCSGIEAEKGQVESKPCSLCKAVKPLEDFHRQPRAKTGRHSWCKACYGSRAPKKKQLTPARRREVNYRARYGMTVAEVESLLASQGGKCAICEASLSIGKCRVDHDHGDGRVRGILCHRCNVGLSLMEDHARFATAIRYLGRRARCDI